MKEENINIKYQNKVNLIFIILVTMYFVFLILVLSSLYNFVKGKIRNKDN